MVNGEIIEVAGLGYGGPLLLHVLQDPIEFVGAALRKGQS